MTKKEKENKNPFASRKDRLRFLKGLQKKEKILKQKRIRFLELEAKAKRAREASFASPYALYPFLKTRKERQEFLKLYDEVFERGNEAYKSCKEEL